MKRLVLVAAAWLLGAACVDAAEVSAVEIVAGDSRDSRGHGFFIRGSEGCVLLTAGHVVGDRAEVTWSSPLAGSRIPEESAGRTAYAPPGPPHAIDIALVTPVMKPRECPAYPENADIRRLAAAGARGKIHLANAAVVDIRIDGRDGEKLAFSALDEGRLSRGMSGAPVSVGGVVVAMVTDIAADGVRGEGAPLDAVAATLGPRWIDPGRLTGWGRVGYEPGRLQNDEGKRRLWKGIGFGLIQAQASAREEYEAAALLGSAAAQALLAELLWAGDGGTRDPVRAASLKDDAFEALLRQAGEGDPGAAFALTKLNVSGQLSTEDRDAAATPVRRLLERLRVRQQAGDQIAASWRALIYAAEVEQAGEASADALARRGGLAVPRSYKLIVFETCETLACRLEQYRAVYDAALVAGRGGEPVGMLLASAIDRRTIGVLAGEGDLLRAPDCEPFRRETDPVSRTALLSCTELRQALAYRAHDRRARSYAGRFGDFRPAIEAGSVPAASAYWQDEKPEIRSVVQRGLTRGVDVERSLAAMFLLGHSYLALNRGDPDWSRAEALLSSFVDRAPPTMSGRGRALANLAGLYLTGGYGIEASRDRFDRTATRLRALGPTEMNHAFLSLRQFAWSRFNPAPRDELEALADELGTSAAQAGDSGAISSLLNLSILESDPEKRQALEAKLEAQLEAQGDLRLFERRCARALEDLKKPASLTAAETACAMAVRGEERVVERLYDAFHGIGQGPRAKRWLERLPEAGTPPVQRRLGRIAIDDGRFEDARKILVGNADRFDASSAVYLIQGAIEGTIPVDDAEFRRLAELAMFSGTSFGCLPTKEGVCVLTAQADSTLYLVGRTGPSTDEKLGDTRPMSPAQAAALHDAMTASGVNPGYPRPAVGPQ